MPLLEAKHRAFQQTVRALVEEKIRPHAAAMDEKGAFPTISYETFRDAGLLIAALPREEGGMNADARMLSVMIEEISRVSPSSALLVFPTSAVIRILALTGNEEQKARFFPRFAKGDKLCGFALSEPNYGSDAGSVQTYASLEGETYTINGSKTYITLGEHAHFFLVFVRTASTKGPAGISALLLERDTPGLTFGPPMKKMGLGASVTQEMFFESVRVPVSNLLLGPERGWEILTRYANPMRVWGAASMSLGIAQGAWEEALSFVQSRIQFKRPVARFQSVAFLIADMKTRIEAARSLVRRTAVMVDKGGEDPKTLETYVSMAKYFASDMAMEVTTEAVQLLGKEGVRSGSPVERLMRDAKAIQIFDGSNQIQRWIVARNLLRQSR